MRETKAEIMSGVTGAVMAKVIASNTVRYTVEGTFDKVIRLHHTNIITFKSDIHEYGNIVLNSGKWRTPTTKARMNEYLPPEWGIVQENSIWYVVHGKGWRKPGEGDYPFADGITLHPDGSVTGAGPDPKEILKLKKRIKGYVEGFMVELLAGRIPKPSGGDCWLCGMIKGDDSHILSHIEEKYYVPILLVNAIEEFPISSVAKQEVGGLLGYDVPMSDWGKEMVARDVKKSLTRYMYRHLGLAA